MLQTNKEKLKSRKEAEREAEREAKSVAERERLAAEEEAVRSAVLTKWERTGSPPQSEQVCLYPQTLICVRKKTYYREMLEILSHKFPTDHHRIVYYSTYNAVYISLLYSYHLINIIIA